MRVRVVLGLALALVGAALVIAISQRGERLAGTSFVPQRAFTVLLPPHASACQSGTFVPDDSAAAQLVVGTYGRPRPTLRVSFAAADGSLIARGRLAGGARQGAVTLPFAAVVSGSRAATACVRNEGAVRVALAGDIANPPAAARIDGRPTGGVVGFRYFRAGRESWWSLMPAIAQRFGVGKARLFGTWTLPLLALLLAGVWFAAIRLLLREEGER